MINLETVNIEQLAKLAKLSKKAQKLIAVGQKPAGFLEVLDKAKLAGDSVNFLANAMPEQDAVWWACKSGDKVQDKMAPADIQAKQAAETWVKNPTPQNQKAAAEAAQKTDFQGPGAWTAQAAAWSKEFAPPIDTQLPEEVIHAHKLIAKETSSGDAVAGAVKLCAAMDSGSLAPPAAPPAPEIPSVEVPKVDAPPPPPVPEEPDMEELTKIADVLKPFIDLGKDILNGNLSWK